ncbi:hypothetical protein F3Y22_tig00112293pilonHSYRG00342 [Hibiscus syriacus]|uniref:Reverse transcriptase n=1 Tax=Hibiscus syriacus TaxID=106335 RepID=A0A6A2XNR5_HIBSY|nr:hypothetical protein F3Y22_tig00112293pilonHSYRG00342 [Hibiscus syriacus]
MAGASCGVFPIAASGDFNEILMDSEKVGGRRKPMIQLDDFQAVLDRNELSDCRPSKGWFTWFKSRNPETMIAERLDRYMASTSWLVQYPSFRVYSEYTTYSDHCFLVMNTKHEAHEHWQGHGRECFRFETCWSHERTCIAQVEAAWKYTFGSTLGKLRTVSDAKHHWKNAKFSKTKKRIKKLKKVINEELSRSNQRMNFRRLVTVKQELHALLDTEERYWTQRSWVNWLIHGDRNIAFFHARSTQRQKKNRICELFGANENWTDTRDGISDVVVDYFMKLFATDNIAPSDSP